MDYWDIQNGFKGKVHDQLQSMSVGVIQMTKEDMCISIDNFFEEAADSGKGLVHRLDLTENDSFMTFMALAFHIVATQTFITAFIEEHNKEPSREDYESTLACYLSALQESATLFKNTHPYDEIKEYLHKRYQEYPGKKTH